MHFCLILFLRFPGRKQEGTGTGNSFVICTSFVITNPRFIQDSFSLHGYVNDIFTDISSLGGKHGLFIMACLNC